jgi:hypothetical protein
MTALRSNSLPLLLCSLWFAAWSAAAGEPGVKVAPGDKVPLDDADLRLITLTVLETNPLLSASSGIKYAEAWRNLTTDSAMVIFHPHSESGGIKAAYQAHCDRDIPDGSWSCPAVVIRRYVKLDSQDFEVRVRGDIDLEGLLAVIEATRGPALTAAKDQSGLPDTVIMVFAANCGYYVSWGSREGMGQVSVEAYLREGGSPTNPNDWNVRLSQPET